MNRIQARKRRGLRTKAVIKKSGKNRLVVFKSLSHIYAQIVSVDTDRNTDRVIVSSSTLDKELRSNISGNKVEQAYQVGKLLGKRAKQQSIDNVAFDRSGYKFHGRIKALAEGAREEGIKF